MTLLHPFRLTSILAAFAAIVGFTAFAPPSLADGCPQISQTWLRRRPSAELDLPRLKNAKDWGPRIQVLADSQTRDPASIKRLTIGQYNVLNLEELRGKAARDRVTGDWVRDPHTGELLKDLPPLAKSKEELQGVAETFRRADPDIAVLEEVESFGALSSFNEQHLDNRYQAILIEGNDARGIDVAFLIKRDLPFDVDVQSLKNVARNASGNRPLFSRDLPVAEFREKGAPKGSRPAFIVMGTHYKSQRGTNFDPIGATERGEQVRATAKVIQYYEAKYGKDVPILLVGDFNRDIRVGPEFKPLWNLGMTDSFELAPAQFSTPPKQRVTHTYHPRKGPTEYNQLDSISVSVIAKQRKLVVEAQVVPYVDAAGKPKPIPKTFDERNTNPSDHMMLRTVLDYQVIRGLAAEAARAAAQR